MIRTPRFKIINIIFQQAVVSNLQASVSQEDLSELFGDVGPLRRVKMLGPGSAEIVFLNKVCYLCVFDCELVSQSYKPLFFFTPPILNFSLFS